MKEPVHVAVQMATVGLPVEVSALHEVEQVMHYIVSSVPRTFVPLLFALGHPLSPREILILNSLHHSCCFQPAPGLVRMEGPWMQEPVHVTVQVASVGLAVKVSALCVV